MILPGNSESPEEAGLLQEIEPVNQSDTRNRFRGGKSDLIIICVIAVVITVALLWTLFKIVNQSEEHVKDVKKTKVSYSAPLQWHPEENDCDVKIKADFEKNPDATRRKYSRYDLTENSLKYIARMHKLKTLNLKESTIEDDWLKYLENSPLAILSLYERKYPIAVCSQSLNSRTRVNLPDRQRCYLRGNGD